MKHLIVMYDGKTLFDGEVDSFQWTESPNTVAVQAQPKKDKPASGQGGGAALIESLLSAAKRPNKTTGAWPTRQAVEVKQDTVEDKPEGDDEAAA